MAEESISIEPLPPSYSISISSSIHHQTATIDPSSPRNNANASRRLNAGAPEFIPTRINSSSSSSSSSSSININNNTRSSSTPHSVMHVFPVPPAALFHHHVPVHNFKHQQEAEASPQPHPADHVSPPTINGLSEDVFHKILNQVEYYFSDANLATTDHLIRFISKDPAGFVPISVVASFNKIKALVSTHHQLAAVLRNSSKLVVSDDGKKVRRQHPLSDSDMEDLQSRIIVAENLPNDHSYQNLMRVFSTVGSVKTIRTCQPQNSNGGPSAASRLSKMEKMLFSNKLHAFVEYENVEIAEKAVTELNDERNWRSGLRVRLLLKPALKSLQTRGRKSGNEGEGNAEDNLSTSDQLNKHMEDSTDMTSHEHTVDFSIPDKDGPRRGRGHGRGKGRVRGQLQNSRGSHVGTPPASNPVNNEQLSAAKQLPGPRMPDGTKGFTMGRGKPVVSDIL